MAWEKRPFGEPFTMALGDEIITERNFEWYDGESFIISVDEPATLTVSSTDGGGLVYVEDSIDGTFDLSEVEQDTFISEGQTKFYYVWTGTGVDQRLRAKGQLRRLLATPPTGIPAGTLLFDGAAMTFDGASLTFT